MKRNVVLAALGRLAASLAALTLLAMPALAGDRALLNVIGYSEDFKYLAFEEFGTFDGSGGQYSHIYIVNLSDDSWVKGTPFSVETSDDGGGEGTTLPTVRSKTMAQAAPVLKSLKIDVPAETLILLGDGVAKADGRAMVVDAPSCCGPNDTDDSIEVKLSLKAFPAKVTGECQVDTALGYSLNAEFADGTTADLHTDGDTLPKSRSCPQDYRLYSVITPLGSGTNRVAIISSYPFDFEGTSRRFLAVPIDPWSAGNQ